MCTRIEKLELSVKLSENSALSDVDLVELFDVDLGCDDLKTADDLKKAVERRRKDWCLRLHPDKTQPDEKERAT
eukprot:7389986-Prymnesium_polylepis.1